MFSFKAAILKILKRPKPVYITLTSFSINLFPQNSQKLDFFFHLKSVVKTIFWQTMKCFIILHPGREWQR
jgi:hypothetical protein